MVLQITVTTPSDSASLFEFAFEATQITIGRSASCDIQLPFPTVSSHHLTILREGEAWLVADVGSTNGSELNNTPLQRDHYVPLHEGDAITINPITITFHFPLYIPGGLTTEEESGEIVRRMAFEYLKKQGPLDRNQAYIEVLQGLDYGERYLLPHDAFTLALGHGAPPSGWRLRDTTLPVGTFTLEGDGSIFALALTSDPKARTFIDGHEIEPGTRVRVRTGARIHAAATTFLFVDPLEHYLQQLEAAPQRPRAETAPHQRPTNLQLDPPSEDPEDPEDFDAPHTQRVQRAHRPPAPTPRTAAGLPLHDRLSRGLATAALAQSNAPEKAPDTSRWTFIDFALLGIAIVLGVAALIVLLVVFEVL